MFQIPDHMTTCSESLQGINQTGMNSSELASKQLTWDELRNWNVSSILVVCEMHIYLFRRILAKGDCNFSQKYFPDDKTQWNLTPENIYK